MHIICLGDLCCDLIVPYGKMQKILASPDLSGEKAGMMNVSMQCGGSVANVARTLGKLGDRPIMVTPVGGDDLGQYLRSEMEKAGVDMDYAVPSAKSNNYCVAVLDGRGERTMFCFVPPWADFPRFSERSFEGIPDADILFTSGMAILAKHYGIPFYTLGPRSTIDMDCPTGADIPIELRDPEEIKNMWYKEPMALPEVKCYNPSFDVTDHELLTAIVTDKGVVYPPFDVNLKKIMEME